MASTSSCISVTQPALVISKINYHPSTEEGEVSSNYEFIEITNASETAVDLTGLYLGELGLTYQFPRGIFMGGNTSLYLANDAKSFEDRYGFIPFDEFTRSLSNESEKILLLDGYGNIIDEVTYSDKVPWPTQADGLGAYLELEDLTLDNNDGANWEGQFSSLIQKGILGGLNTLQPVVSIFPNPSKEKFYITAGGKIRLVNIWSIEGKSMGQYRFNSEKVELILNDYKVGTYYIEIQTEIGRFLRRFIRN